VILGIDIDGVCAEFADSCNFWLAERLDMDPQPIDRWDWYENYGSEGPRAWREFWRMTEADPDWMGLVPPVPGAAEGVHALEDAGHEVIYVTARNPRYQEATWEWLEGEGFVPKHLIHTKDKHLVECDLYLDDSVGNIDSLRENDCNAVLFIREWNEGTWWSRMLRGVDYIPSVRSWDQFVWFVGSMEALAHAR